MRFDSNKVAFGRHETFPLRFSWLTKGFEALKSNPKVFSSDEATVSLGVGKNMVSAIRYWLTATRMIESDNQQGFVATELGESIFGDNGYDPYLEDEGTIWLIHWLLASSPTLATSWYWFFNRYHKQGFTADECSEAIQSFVQQSVQAKTSKRTVDQDIKVMLRMYARGGASKISLEDMLDSPLSLLNLVNRDSQIKKYRSSPAERMELPLGIFTVAVVETFESMGVDQIPIAELISNADGYSVPGAVFRLTENRLVTLLEIMADQFSDHFELRETAGIHQLYKLEELSRADVLAYHYSNVEGGRLAA